VRRLVIVLAMAFDLGKAAGRAAPPQIQPRHKPALGRHPEQRSDEVSLFDADSSRPTRRPRPNALSAAHSRAKAAHPCSLHVRAITSQMLSRHRYISCEVSKLFTGLTQPFPFVLQNKDAFPSAAISSLSTPSQCGQCNSIGVKKWFMHSDTKITPSCIFRLSTNLPSQKILL
jgi:hypothetical protein